LREKKGGMAPFLLQEGGEKKDRRKKGGTKGRRKRSVLHKPTLSNAYDLWEIREMNQKKAHRCSRGKGFVTDRRMREVGQLTEVRGSGTNDRHPIIKGKKGNLNWGTGGKGGLSGKFKEEGRKKPMGRESMRPPCGSTVVPWKIIRIRGGNQRGGSEKKEGGPRGGKGRLLKLKRSLGLAGGPVFKEKGRRTRFYFSLEGESVVGIFRKRKKPIGVYHQRGSASRKARITIERGSPI